jgi:MFS family permease
VSARESVGADEGLSLAYAALLSLACLDSAGYSIIAPVTPAISGATGAGPTLIGILVASFPVGIMAGFVLGAAAVTRGRETPLMLGSLGLIALGSLGFVLGDGLAVYFPARLIAGLGSGGVWMAVAFGTLARWPGQEYVCMGRMLAAYSAGSLIGPLLGAAGGIQRPFLLYTCLVVLAAGAAWAMPAPPSRQAFHADRRALRLRGFWAASAGIAFAVLALGIVDGVLPLHFAQGLSQAGIGLLYGAAAVVNVAAAAVAVRWRPRAVLLVGIGLVVAGTWVAAGTGAVSVWVPAMAALAAGIGAANTGSIGVLLEAVGVERIVTAMILWSQLGILGYMVGPIAAGAAAQWMGFVGAGVVAALAGFLVVFLAVRPLRGTRLVA